VYNTKANVKGKISRFYEEIHHEKNLSAQEKAKKQRTRLQKKNGYKERQERSCQKTPERKSKAERVIKNAEDLPPYPKQQFWIHFQER